ncbi:hypothetical protein PC129_g13785 [Phytophthora cactorum]|uniref:Uncharacterized protein n=1 Tax=Phytophthora cactorum TaxID=29920 RepID=A0A329RQN7_9STRA|nr:hypothetical protein Pcac1_g7646 [Phytophthora cactorum]KAG2802633.1 hypothetical protein PC111_g19023 [Phytophthora cactorum]KAG2829874.1 hypothetical protein PC112_g7927 [Phytophthora cactorum]KAG2841500.1 hypothetical protein PC113_g19019 [Phytophthora cactorum]KAG2913279.1 hypothetical protein PC114_g8592 [Phytophthora cactorum]
MVVAAPDDEEGGFPPTQRCGMVLLAATLTKVKDGKALVPAINVQGGRVRLPSKKELGTWIPVDKDVDVLSMKGAIPRDKLDEWLSELGDEDPPLDSEDEVRIEGEDSSMKYMMLKLLRAYREVSTNKGDCPPITTLAVQHHIDTGNAAPIMLNRRCQAQTGDAIVE